MDPEKIKLFVLKFFENLKCSVHYSNGILVVSGVPGGFEKFCGRKAPYKFCFEEQYVSGDVEYLSQGSFLLKAINDYLEGRGQTTLLKIDFDPDFKEVIENRFELKNCKITNVARKFVNNTFFRFSFLTVFQHLHGKEQSINHVYVKEREIVDFDLDKYKAIEGKKRDSNPEGIDEAYKLAKSNLKVLLEPKTKKVVEMINVEVEKEIERIKKHYEVQQMEYKNKNKKNGADEEGVKKIKKEEERKIQDEIQKHGLDIRTKLMNTTIIYYPVFSGNLFFKNKVGARIVSFEFDPMSGKHSKFFCDSCKSEIEEIILCGSGHLTCRNCGERCENCKEVFCNLCLKKNCSQCGKIICEKCAVRCSKCGKYKCLDHVKTQKFSGERVCDACLKRCYYCGEFYDKDSLKVDENSGKDVCFKCLNKEVGRRTLKDIFKE